MEKNTFYITTPIYYPSDKLHIGHTYCTVATDAIARYKRLQGYDVMFLTGTDEHGQKIETKAEEAGMTPQAFVDRIVEGERGVRDLWKLMNISNDRFIRTTDDYHCAAVQKIFKKMYDNGDIYKGAYKGKYCTPCESFWTESQLVDGKCPDCGREVHDAEEEAYFFRLSKYADKVRHLLEDTDFLQPRSRVNEMVNNFIKPGLEDLCVSRTSFTWGIPVDFDPGHVVYVWVDALFNYCTALGLDNDRYHDFEKFWPADYHIVGKEIVRFHSIIWPAMLMSVDLPLPKHVYGHGWLVIDGGKMSKSKGNVVDPYVLAEMFGVDALRFFLLRTFPFGSDGNFSNELLISTINTDLANKLGNLVSRTTGMVEKYFGGKLPAAREDAPEDCDLKKTVCALRGRYEAEMDKLQLQNGLDEIFKVIDRANKYIDETAPWTLGKDESKHVRLATVLYNLLETIRVCTTLLMPVMPDTCEKIFAKIGAGAAAIAITKLLLSAGFKDITMCDRKGAIYKGREGLNWIKTEMAEVTNLDHKAGSLADMLVGADVFIGVSAPNTVTTEMVKTMNKDAIIFACANPTPEIFPDAAKAGGAKVISTGRSDYPNQINNVLAFPGIFRGAFDVRASDINEEMKVAAAEALAALVGDQLSEDYIIPAAFDPRVGSAVAKAVAEAARKSGVARI